MKATNFLFILLVFLGHQNFLFAKSQFSEFTITPLLCDMKIGEKVIPLTIEEQQITSNYKITLIQYETEKKKVTLSSLATVLNGKCLIYFYAFNPETELFEMRLRYSHRKSELSGQFFYQKEKEQIKAKINCKLEKKQSESLPTRCHPRQTKTKQKKKNKPNRQMPNFENQPGDKAKPNRSGPVSSGTAE